MNNKTEPIKFNHRIRLVVSDLDGTLLNEEKRISPRSLAAIRKLRRCGVLFTVCTGREYAILEHYAKQIQPSAPMICNNGGEVVSFPQGKVIFRRLLPKPEILSLVEYCLSQGADFCITTPEGAYFPNGSAMTGFYSAYHKQSRQEGLHLFPIHYISTGQELESLPLNKMIFRSDLTSAENIIQYIRRELPAFDTTMSSENILEVIPRGINKAEGLVQLCSHLGISLSECCAVGDYENDIELLTTAGLSVAMGNALPSVKKIADYVIASNEEDGVALLLEQIAAEYAL